MKKKNNFSNHLYGMYGIKILFCLCLVFTSGWFSDSFDLNAQDINELDIEIVKAVWTNGVDQLKGYNELKKVNSLSEPLYFLIYLKGKEKALKYLEDNNSIPIEVRWFYIIGTRILPSGTVNLSINKEKLLALRKEFNERGFFDWRTYTKKTSIGPGWFQVKIFCNNSPILCQNATKQAHCQYEIEVL